MCGVAGYYSWSGRPLPPGRIEAMTEVLRHRGPDDAGTFVDGGFALGHRRLSIIDLSTAGRQPMANEDGSVLLVFNGEIYNYASLRAELIKKKHVFRSNTDSEVIIHQYEEDGVDCVERFNGMFSFAVVDLHKRQLLLARDRAGQKPLFYASGPDYLLFGSEIKSLLASGLVSAEVCPEALQICMQYNAMGAPYTIFKGVQQLLPGHRLVCGADGLPKVACYWNLVERLAKKVAIPANDAEWLEAFGEKLARSVTARMRSDAPFGAFLSGGLDSAAVVGIMASQQPKVRTFSFGFQEASFDETPLAGEVARFFDASHQTVSASYADLPGLVEAAVYHGEEYTPNPCFIPVYLLCREAAGSVKMVLSGDGADEYLAGYETYQASCCDRWFRMMPKPLRSLAAGAVQMLPPSEARVPLENKLKRFIYGSQQAGAYSHTLWRHIFTRELMHETLQPGYLVPGFDPGGLYKCCIDAAGAAAFLDQLLLADFNYYLPNDALVKVDRMGMAHGLEIRAPFLDHELVELCFRMPRHLKLNRFFSKKHILRKYLRGRVPGKILQQKKMGFNVPVDSWLRNGLKTFMLDHLTPDRIKRQGVFRPETVARIMSKHLSGEQNFGLELWNLLCFSVWHDMFPVGMQQAAFRMPRSS